MRNEQTKATLRAGIYIYDTKSFFHTMSRSDVQSTFSMAPRDGFRQSARPNQAFRFPSYRLCLGVPWYGLGWCGYLTAHFFPLSFLFLGRLRAMAGAWLKVHGLGSFANWGGVRGGEI